MTVAQDGPCDRDGEQFFPMSVDAVLDNPEILLRQVGTGNPVVRNAPAASDLYGLGEGFFLDFPGSSLEPGCIYERDFRRYTDALPPTVYAHIARQDDRPDQLAVQYWFYWYYNDWNNKHESDWEGIQLLFDTGSVAEALDGEPVSVGYAQHEGGESADWNSDKLQREGTRPVVYPSAGSHASYYEDDFHLGRGASEGFGCDTTVGPSNRLDPDVVLLPDSIDDPDHPLAWLAYEGRWGERQRGAFNGPTGPITKSRWTHPVDWHDELRPSSVLIPGGESSATDVITTFCNVVERGSGLLITLTVSPLRLLVVALASIALVTWLVRRTDWSPVPLVPLRRRRRGGQILRASFDALRRSSTLRRLGLLYLPVTVVAGVVGRAISSLPFVHQVLDLAGTGGITGLVLALTVAGFAHLVAFVGINAAAAVHLDTRSVGTAPGRESTTPATAPIGDVLVAVWDRRVPLLVGFVRAYVTIVVLLVSVVGIPWALRLLVRSQFSPHLVMLEELDGRDALRRSGELVRGRWWHTAGMVVVVNLLVASVSVMVGLALLVLFAALPLWFFSVVLALAYAAIAPVAALAVTLLFGDALAAEQGPVDAVDTGSTLDDTMTTSPHDRSSTTAGQ